MSVRSLTSIFLLLVPSFLTAQLYEPCGGRASGMGNAVVTLSDSWSPFHNIAGIAAQKRYGVGLWYKNNYAVQVYKEISMIATGPLWKGGAAISFYRFGNEAYNTNRIAIGYSNKIGFFSLGGQLHYVQTLVENVKVSRSAAFELGGIAELVPSRLFFGANIFNINQAKMEGELLPVLMKAGLSYRYKEKLMLNGEVEKDLLYKPSVKAGIEYWVIERFRIRTGINTNPFINFFGAGFHNSIFQLDYSIALHHQLGTSHRVSLLIFFK